MQAIPLVKVLTPTTPGQGLNRETYGCFSRQLIEMIFGPDAFATCRLWIV